MLAGIYESRGDARMHWREHALHTRSPSLPVDGPQIVADKLQRCEAALHAAASHSY
jgi:hypothetical protein